MRHRIALSSALAAACAAAAPASIARAQTSAAAELAFREGRQLMNQGRYQEACPKFEESQRLDPAPGTQLNLADCYEKQGRTASAWETFRAAEAAAHDSGQPDFASEARRRAVALEPRLCKLALSAAQPVAGLEVALDGEPVTELIGSAVPVDPGEHAVTASAPARRPWSQRVRIDAPGTTVAVAIPALPAIAAGDRAPPRAEARARRPRTGGGGGRRMTPLSWGLAVGAGAALAVGVGLDIAAYRDLSDCRDRCSRPA